MNYSAFRSGLISQSSRPEIAEKAAERAEEWWNMKGRAVCASAIGTSKEDREKHREDKKKRKVLRAQMYKPCYDYTLAGFAGGFIIAIIIQAIVAWIVKRILDRLIDNYFNNQEEPV